MNILNVVLLGLRSVAYAAPSPSSLIRSIDDEVPDIRPLGPAVFEPGSLILFSEPFYKGNARAFVAKPNKCNVFTVADTSSIIQFPGAVCNYYALNTCEMTNLKPAFRVDSKGGMAAYQQLSVYGWEDKVWSVMCWTSWTGALLRDKPVMSLDGRKGRYNPRGRRTGYTSLGSRC